MLLDIYINNFNPVRRVVGAPSWRLELEIFSSKACKHRKAKKEVIELTATSSDVVNEITP